MLKNKTKIVTILVLIILTFMVPFVYADEPNSVVNSESNEQPQINIPEMKKNDIYFSGDTISIDNPVDGNLFIIANDVTINTQIGGNAFIIAKNINLTENAYIFSSLFASANELNTNGVVFDIYANANKANINGFIYRDIRINAKDLVISGVVSRNAYLSVSNLNFNVSENQNPDTNPNASGTISGNLHYSSPKEFDIKDNQVGGEIKYNSQKSFRKLDVSKYIISLGSILALVSIVWLLYRWQTPNFIKEMDILLSTPKNLINVILNGIIFPLLIILISTILILIPITSKVALLLILSFLLLILLSKMTFLIGLNKLISRKLKLETSLISYASLLVITLIFWVLSNIPFVGPFINLVAIIIGLGLLTNRYFPNSKPKKNKEIKQSEKLAKEKEKVKDKNKNKDKDTKKISIVDKLKSKKENKKDNKKESDSKKNNNADKK